MAGRPPARAASRRSGLRRCFSPPAQDRCVALAAALLLGTALRAVGAQGVGPACALAGDCKPIVLDVVWSGDRLSLEVRDAPLSAVLEAVAEAAGLELVLGHVSSDRIVHGRFDALPLGTVLRRLLGEEDYLLLMGPAADDSPSGGRLWVFPRSGHELAAPLPAAEPMPTNDEDEAPADAMAIAASLASASSRGRRVAVHDLGELPGPTAVALLSAALGDADPQVREAAVEELAALGTGSARIAIHGALQDPDADVRLEAVDALAEFDDTQSTDALQRALTDADERVREAAADYLAERTD